MNKDTFWAIIEKTKDLDTEIMYSNLIEELKILPEKDVQIFRAYIDGYMELSSETIWVDMACKVINGYVSDDTGLYFTLWLISCGEIVFLNALNDPDTLSELPKLPFGDADFEMLMGIGMDENGEGEMDYELMEKLKEKIIEEITPTIKYKDGERYGKYKTFEDGMEDIPNILPKLIKRAEIEEFDWRNYI
jgi:hypothetical protein